MAATEQPLIDLNGFEQPQPPKDAMAVAEGAGPDGHVLTVIAKRMRAAKKKITRIEGIEKSRQEGKAINSDQVLSKHRQFPAGTCYRLYSCTVLVCSRSCRSCDCLVCSSIVRLSQGKTLVT